MEMICSIGHNYQMGGVHLLNVMHKKYDTETEKGQ